MNENMETRLFIGAVESRASEDGSKITIEGKPIVFDQATDIGGWWEESIAPGAIKEDALKDVRLLVNHNFDELPLARSRRNTKNSTMRLAIEEKDVAMEADLDSANPRALEADSAIKRGDVTGMSFAFIVDGDEWSDLDTDYPKRRITSISQIFEVSICTFPAYEGTAVASRSLDSGKRSLADARAALESAKKKQEKISELNERLKEINCHE